MHEGKPGPASQTWQSGADEQWNTFSARNDTRALQGNWRAEHLFTLQQAVTLYEFYHQQITSCDGQIGAHLRTFVDKSEGKTLPPDRISTNSGQPSPALTCARRCCASVAWI